jgi:hypothetical protein
VLPLVVNTTLFYFETLHKKQLTADDADFADLTLIFLLKLMVELQNTVYN